MKEFAENKADQLYEAACLFALCAEPMTPPIADAARLTKQCADEAMRLLKHAVARGYTDAAHMQGDTDLASLRDRDDFRELLAKLKTGNDSKKLP
jgi:hypothetical protein